jgi:hypothetical protein
MGRHDWFSVKLSCSRTVIYAGLALLWSAINTAMAEDETEPLRQRGDWWLGIDTGVGAIKLELPEGSLEENKFYLGFRAEYFTGPKLSLGIDASGWLLQSGEVEYNTNPPPLNYERQLEGEGLAPVLLMARYYPQENAGWYLKAGAGYVSHWKTTQGVTDRKSGTGIMLGTGYDYVINKNWDITGLLSYSSGSAGDEDYDAVTLSVGFNYRIRRK